MSERLLNQGGGAPDTSLWYCFGPQGETRQLTDANGNVADTYQYTAYGIMTASTGSDVNPYRYGGQFGYYAPFASNFYLCGLRWYDGDTGRFLSRDPIGYDGGDNLYAYCGGDPVDNADPDGLDPNYWKSPFYRDPKHYHGPKPPLPDVPPGFDIDKNIAECSKKSASNPLDDLWFRNQVHTGGTWDPKNKTNPKTHHNYGAPMDPAGNFNYGACGKSMGFASQTLYKGAGSAQPATGPEGWESHPGWGAPPLLSNRYQGSPPYYGDDPPGHHETNYGIMYYEYWWKLHHRP